MDYFDVVQAFWKLFLNFFQNILKIKQMKNDVFMGINKRNLSVRLVTTSLTDEKCHLSYQNLLIRQFLLIFVG